MKSHIALAAALLAVSALPAAAQQAGAPPPDPRAGPKAGIFDAGAATWDMNGPSKNPREVGAVQTCRGSHTHSLLVDPKDPANVYIYVSGSSPVRPADEMKGCADEGQDPASALFRIEVIKVPVAHPEQAAIVSSPRIFNDLVAPPEHGM